MKRITLEELEKNGKFETYEALYRHILSEISSGRLSPVKASGINGKKPALYLRYWVTEERLRVFKGRINLRADAPDLPGLLLKEPVTL